MSSDYREFGPLIPDKEVKKPIIKEMSSDYRELGPLNLDKEVKTHIIKVNAPIQLTQQQQNAKVAKEMATEFQHQVMNTMCPTKQNDYATCIDKKRSWEDIKTGYKMCGEKVKEQYDAFLVETDPNKKEIQKLFLKYLLEKFYKANMSPDRYPDYFRYIMECPTTFVPDKEKYTNDEIKQKYGTWYIPKGKFDTFAREIGLDSAAKEYYERTRQQYVVFEFSETDTGRWLKKTFARSSGGKKRNQSKKSKKRRYSKRR